MDAVDKIYKSTQVKGISELNKFLDEANKKFYDIISVTQLESFYTIVYKDYER